MFEIPESIKAILREESVSARGWKRIRDEWQSAIAVLQPDIEACQRILDEADKLLHRFRNIQIIEIRTLPEQCVTLKDAEKAMAVQAINQVGVLKSANMLGIGKTTLYRKLKQYGIERPPHPNSITVKAKIASLEAEIVRLRAQLPEEAMTA